MALQFIKLKMGILTLSALLNTLKIPVNGYQFGLHLQCHGKRLESDF